MSRKRFYWNGIDLTDCTLVQPAAVCPVCSPVPAEPCTKAFRASSGLGWPAAKFVTGYERCHPSKTCVQMTPPFTVAKFSKPVRIRVQQDSQLCNICFTLLMQKTAISSSCALRRPRPTFPTRSNSIYYVAALLFCPHGFYSWSVRAADANLNRHFPLTDRGFRPL